MQNEPINWIDPEGLTGRPFWRPIGVPRGWIPKPSRSGGGRQWINPRNTHERVRYQPGNPKSPNPAQQKPYYKYQRDGKFYDKHGNEVPGDAPEAHIPANEFKFPLNMSPLWLDLPDC